jgi:biotin operon repressor
VVDLVSWFIPATRLPKALSLLGKSRLLRKVAPKASKAPKAGNKVSTTIELSRHAKARLGVETARKKLQDNGFRIIAREVEFQGAGVEFRTRCDLVVAKKTHLFCVEVKYSKGKKFTFTPNQQYYHQHDVLVGRFVGQNAKVHHNLAPSTKRRVGMHQMCYHGENVVSTKCPSLKR